MNTNLSKHSFTAAFFARNVFAIISLLLARHFLSNWYLYRHTGDYFFFSLMIAAAVVFIWGNDLSQAFKRAGTGRFIALGLMFLVLPWGEWLQLNFPRSREDWSRQIYRQIVFLYVLWSLMLLFPQLSQWTKAVSTRLLTALSAKQIFKAAACIAFFLLTSALAIFHFEQTPMVEDTAGHLFQSRVFAAGKITAPAPEKPEFFDYSFDSLAMNNGRWFSIYLPGFALLLAPFTFLHLEWFVSPFLAALTLWFWLSFIQQRTGKNSPQVSLFALFYLGSPFLLIMSGTIMVHTPELFAASAVLYICSSLENNNSLSHKILLFLFLFLGMIVRGFSLFPFLFPVLAWMTFRQLRQSRFVFPAVAFAGLACGVAVILFYQWQTTGSPFKSPYLLEIPDYKFGFGRTLFGQIHTPVRGLENISNNLLGLNHWLGGWYSGAVAFLIGFFLFCRFHTWDKILLLSCLGLSLFYYFMAPQDLILGPRFFFLLAPVLLYFITRLALSAATPRLFSVIILSFGLSIVYNVPRNVVSSKPMVHFKKELQKMPGSPSIIFLEKKFNAYVNWNDPFFRNNIFLSRDFGDLNNQDLVRAIPGAKVMYYAAEVSFEGLDLRGNYKLMNQRIPRSVFQFFQFSLALQSAENFPDEDVFDVCYRSILRDKASEEIRSVIHDSPGSDRKLNEVQSHFAASLINSAAVMTIPKEAFEESGDQWKERLDYESFRLHLMRAMHHARMSGALGSKLSAQMLKVWKRIDHNGNGTLTDQEIYSFIRPKMQYFQKY